MNVQLLPFSQLTLSDYVERHWLKHPWLCCGIVLDYKVQAAGTHGTTFTATTPQTKPLRAHRSSQPRTLCLQRYFILAKSAGIGSEPGPDQAGLGRIDT